MRMYWHFIGMIEWQSSAADVFKLYPMNGRKLGYRGKVAEIPYTTISLKSNVWTIWMQCGHYSF